MRMKHFSNCLELAAGGPGECSFLFMCSKEVLKHISSIDLAIGS